jgi:hypothetical protein
VGHQRRDLRDREHEHQVEEQLERGYPLFLYRGHSGGRTLHQVPDGAAETG